MGDAWHVAINHDEVFTIDNQSWFFLGNDNLIKVVMEVLMIGGGLPKNQFAWKFNYFGENNDNVF